MLRRNIAWSILAVGVASAMWACSSDGDDTASTGGSGGASAGSTGHAGSSGATAQGGSAGKGGATAAGGSAGKGGATAQGGGAGKGGATAAGGNAAAGTGDALGGEGGATGGTTSIGQGGEGGGEVAQGGEGGATAPTLADNCATVCGDQTGLSCSFGASCVSGCIGFGTPPDGTAFPEEYAAMMACQAKNLAAAQYYCSVPSAGPAAPAPVAGTDCEALICKWTCDDGTNVDENVFIRCGC